MDGVDKYKKNDDAWTQCMIRVGRKQTEWFEQDNMAYADVLIYTQCTRHLMRWVYHRLVNSGRIKKIEEIEQNAKEDLWSFVKEICDSKTNDIVVMKEIAMVFYAIEYFLNEQK